MADIIYHQTIKLTPRTKKNSQRMARSRDGRMFPVQSKEYVKFERECLKLLKEDREPISEPVNVKCVYYVKDNRTRDLVNLQNATLDILVKAGILEDDKWQIVQSMDGSRVYIDKEEPRTEITITRYSTHSL